MSFAIVTDTSSNLMDETIDQYNLTILPLTFMIDGEIHTSYTKGEKSNLPEFYRLMREGKIITTSLPKLTDSEKSIENLLKEGKDVLYIGFSSGLSGTFEATDLLCKQLAEKYPDQKILTVDTLAASGGEGLLVWLACEMREKGSSIEEVHSWLEVNKLKLAHWFTVDDLHYLERGGRVSKTAAFAGSLLKIKPVLHVDNEGHLIPMEKVKGRKKSLQALLDHMEKTADAPVKDQKVYITHGDCEEEAIWLMDAIKEKFGVTDIHINCIDPVIGAHSGPGTMALFFLASER